MTSSARYLLDVNVAFALLDQAHTHHTAASVWFGQPGLKWSLCALTEGGILRLLTNARTLNLSGEQATDLLGSFTSQAGYLHQPINADWQTLTKPFAKRLHGHNQITDAYLLGLAIHEGLVLTTFDKAILHLAREYKENVIVL